MKLIQKISIYTIIAMQSLSLLGMEGSDKSGQSSENSERSLTEFCKTSVKDEFIVPDAAYCIAHGKKHCLRYSSPKPKEVNAKECPEHKQFLNILILHKFPVATFHGQDGDIVGEVFNTISSKKKLYKAAAKKLDPRVKPYAITHRLEIFAGYVALKFYDQHGYRLLSLMSIGKKIPMVEQDMKAASKYVDLSKLKTDQNNNNNQEKK